MPHPRLRRDDPKRIGRYLLIRRLGHGAQGIVYLARTPDGHRVAVKLLHADRTARPGSRERLAKEAVTARRVRGRSTARILDVHTDGPRPYIVSEYVAGPSLHQRVRKRGPLTGPALDRLTAGTATALVTIHRSGVVHRDLKPANVLLGPDGPRVIDFGVAHVEDATITLTGTRVGTPAYMAPEQVAGETAGSAADVFAWASTVVYAATGAPPFGRDSAASVMNRIAHHDPMLGELRGPLRALLHACLNRVPAARPTAEQVLDRLREIQACPPEERTVSVGMPARRARSGPGRAPGRPRSTQPRTARSGSGRTAARSRIRRPAPRRAPRTRRRDPRARRRGYALAVAVTMLLGLLLGVTYPWGGPDQTPRPSVSSTP